MVKTRKLSINAALFSRKICDDVAKTHKRRQARSPQLGDIPANLFNGNDFFSVRGFLSRQMKVMPAVSSSGWSKW
jgi:hypothetical protein